MAEQLRLTKKRGTYTLRARADAVARTRERITRAAVELHGTVGPAATTMSAVAERAGVTRATLYRHFANEEALFGACSRSWLAEHPRPETALWATISDPEARIGTALRQLYAYYASARSMLANLYRDFSALPEPVRRNIASYPDQLLAVLEVGWQPTDDARILRAAILHATAFETWRSLTGGGLSDDEAAALMARLVTATARRAPKRRTKRARASGGTR